MKATVLTKETVLDFGKTDRGFPEFRVGDTVDVGQVVREGEKQRIQQFKGYVIAFHNKGISTSFTVRRLSADGIFVERIFPYYSPLVDNINVVKRGKVRRAKLYYIREKVGKAARIKELVLTRAQKEAKGYIEKKSPKKSKKKEKTA